MDSIYGFTLEELSQKLALRGFSAYRAKQIFGWIYKKNIEDFSDMTNIGKKQQDVLKKTFSLSKFEPIRKEVSKDKTEKALFELADKKLIETALIPEKSRNTLCLSTQVGCGYNCTFCASKQGGFVRNLETFEIVRQYLEFSKKYRITNLVYMGIGEPLDNFDNTVKSIKILTEPAGANFTKRRISLSTCGLPDKIKKLAGLNLGIKLSVSLHAVTNSKRSRLMPVNNKYPLEELFESVKYYQHKQKYPVTFEYILLEDFNVGEDDVKKLAKLIRQTGAKLNLIPYNGKEKASLAGGGESLSFIEEKHSFFIKNLRKEKIIFTLRKSRGPDINAACGQLRSYFRRIDEKGSL